MLKSRDIVIFFAGAEFFHTLSHIILQLSVHFPWQTKYMLITGALNNWAIMLNALATVLLLVWASKMKKEKSRK